MSTTSDIKKQVRLEQQVYDQLMEIKNRCPWPATIGAIANYALANGMKVARRTFNNKIAPAQSPARGLKPQSHKAPR